MGIWGWFSELFSDRSSGADIHQSDPVGSNGSLFEDDLIPDTDSSLDDSAVNPANGLPMVGGEGGIDVEGNPFGTDHSFDSFSDIDDSFVTDHSFDSFSGIDDSFGCDDGFDDW